MEPWVRTPVALPVSITTGCGARGEGRILSPANSVTRERWQVSLTGHSASIHSEEDETTKVGSGISAAHFSCGASDCVRDCVGVPGPVRTAAVPGSLNDSDLNYPLSRSRLCRVSRSPKNARSAWAGSRSVDLERTAIPIAGGQVRATGAEVAQGEQTCNSCEEA